MFSFRTRAAVRQAETLETARRVQEAEYEAAVRRIVSGGSRVYVSASRDVGAPLLTPGQAARGHGGRR